ncbi:MAG: hypothetical protein Q9195_007460 [Heterodermia aff. obscurata]
MARRPSRSPAALARVRVKNRRKRYLDIHQECRYVHLLIAPFDKDPLAYDRLVRRFQSAPEREAEGRKKGYSGVLEADLWRSEAKAAAAKNSLNGSDTSYSESDGGGIPAVEKDEIPRDKEDGLKRWQKQMELMFLRGGDPEFDYSSVDQSEEYDDRGLEEREVEEAWFEEEEPQWITDSESSGQSKALTGQTGLQDF